MLGRSNIFGSCQSSFFSHSRSFWDALQPGRFALVIPYGSIQLFKSAAYGPGVYHSVMECLLNICEASCSTTTLLLAWLGGLGLDAGMPCPLKAVHAMQALWLVPDSSWEALSGTAVRAHVWTYLSHLPPPLLFSNKLVHQLLG